MKKISLIVALSLVGCIGVNEPPNVIEDYYRPINNREWTLKKELEKLGYKDVYFQIPMSRDFNYVQTYYLSMKPEFFITNTNIDSMVRFRDSLSKELYVNIIDDSVLVDLRNLFISFYPPKCKTCKSISEKYAVEELAKKYNFKVVRDRKGGYNRIPLN